VHRPGQEKPTPAWRSSCKPCCVSLFASSALEDHWLAFLVGSGRNGKGTLIEKCAARAMGSYTRRIPAEVLLADDRGTRHPTEIANLVGARLAYASEIDEGRRWNESRLKELSGGDKLSGRFMR
jgi:putative DNA primase/helicase